MTALDGRAQTPKCLFVVCNDYGELSLAMEVLGGQQRLIERSTILVPPVVKTSSCEGLPVRVAEYGQLADVIEAVEREAPDAVILLSGYLLSLHGNLSIDELPSLIEQLRSRGIAIVTSDPFFGLAGADVARAFRIVIPNASWLRRLAAAKETSALIRHLTAAASALADVPHLYPVRPEAAGTGAARISFYNDHLVSPSAGRRHDRSSWLFVLGAADYELQSTQYGEAEFLRLLRARLDDGARAGRHVTFIGPGACVHKLDAAGSTAAELMTFCAYQAFAQRIVEAEYVFYWNALSHSNILRLVNRLPSFTFDVGHMVRHVSTLYARVGEWGLHGWEPTVLDVHETLDGGHLGLMAARAAIGLGRFHERMAQSPPPAVMLEQAIRSARDRAACA